MSSTSFDTIEYTTKKEIYTMKYITYIRVHPTTQSNVRVQTSTYSPLHCDVPIQNTHKKTIHKTNNPIPLASSSKHSVLYYIVYMCICVLLKFIH